MKFGMSIINCHSEQFRLKKSFSPKPKRQLIYTQSAFTFIEIAIVLVISGMIVAGVIGAQSLINSSRTSSLISEVSQIKTAVNSFRLQFDGNLPGDIRNATDYWSTTINGNGNGKITQFGSGTDRELFAVFEHLSLAEIIKDDYERGGDPYVRNVGGVIMRSSYSDGAGYMLYSTPTTAGNKSFEAFYTNSYENGLVVKVAKDRSNQLDDSFISPQNASKIDKKYDDDSIDSGEIRANSGYDGTAYKKCLDVAAASTNWDLTSAEADADVSDPNCIMFFFIERENL